MTGVLAPNKNVGGRQMPKMKTGKGAKKRFKVTGTGKLLRRHGMRRQPQEEVVDGRARVPKMYDVAESDVKSVTKLLRRRLRCPG